LSCADPTTRQLASEIAASLGTKLGDISIKAFADGEIGIQIQESVRGLDTYVVAVLITLQVLFLLSDVVLCALDQCCTHYQVHCAAHVPAKRQ
jgi:hypothetical protein